MLYLPRMTLHHCAICIESVHLVDRFYVDLYYVALSQILCIPRVLACVCVFVPSLPVLVS